MDQVKVFKNCISSDDAQSIIDYINKNQNSFSHGPENLRFTKKFGRDNAIVNKGQSQEVITGIDEIEDKIKLVVDLLIKYTSDSFQENKDLYLASLWLAKQVSGASFIGHSDTGGGNLQFAYTAILYLNTTSKSSPLEFPNLNINIMPSAGDLVIFRSEQFHKVELINEDRYSIAICFTKDKEYDLKFGAK